MIERQLNRVLTAMSGGVDSSVAPLLLLQSGISVGGAIMCLREGMEDEIGRAESVAEQLGIPFYVFSLQEEFNREVVLPFVRSYRAGITPNPCVMCNQKMKFGLFLDKALELGYDGIATGHYARTAWENGRYVLKKARNMEKDQSYVLYSLTQEQLSRTVFPLGSVQKEDVRQKAKEQMFKSADQKDSQDICFIPDGDYASFIRKTDGMEDIPGIFEDRHGNPLGRHAGITHYTVGQRKGLGLALPEPYYVYEKDAERNRVVLCPKKDMAVRSFFVHSFNWVSIPEPERPVECSVRTRYHQTETKALLCPAGNSAVEIRFEEPQMKPAPGQSAVAYDGEYVLGGGIVS